MNMIHKKSYLVHVTNELDIYYYDAISLIYHIPYRVRHREDGPAVIYSDGRKMWILHEKILDCSSQEEFERLMKLKAFW